MTEIAQSPLKGEKWFDKGIPSWQTFNFLSQVSDIFAIISQGIFSYARYADLAAVDLAIKAPVDGYTVMFTGQGLGTYNSAASQWRLSADDTTLIT